jgi:hypothetical protein
MNEVTASVPGLRSEFRNTLLRLQPFGAGLVAAARGKTREAEYTNEDHQEVERLLNRFRENTDDDGFRRAIDQAKRELSGYVGLSGESAYAKLRETPAQER